MTRFSYVMGVHNSATMIPGTTDRVVSRLADFPGSELILVENGSSDSTAAVCRDLARHRSSAAVTVIAATSQQGLGHAFRHGLAVAAGDVVVLTADDLPFEFTDLDGYLAQEPRPRLVIGSKGHPASDISAPLLRRAMSLAFRALRTVLLGIHAADTQGTIFLDADLGRQLLPHLACGDYLISTEVVAWADRLGATAVEVPVRYAPPERSTVSPLRDASRMAVGLVQLRARLRASDASSEGSRPTPTRRLRGRAGAAAGLAGAALVPIIIKRRRARR